MLFSCRLLEIEHQLRAHGIALISVKESLDTSTATGKMWFQLRQSAGFPTSRRQLHDKLQVKLAVFDDRIEVKSFFPVEPVGVQLCTSIKGD